MITLSISKKDIDNLNKQVTMKVESIKYLTNTEFSDAICRAAFVIVTRKFMPAIDKFSGMNPKVMHHVYEWGKVGSPRGRLFVMSRMKITNGSYLIQSTFTKSKVPSPVDPELLMPGKTGKYVYPRNIFKNKAEVMEKGLSINYQAKRFQPFVGINGMQFIRPGQRVYIQNPGGKYTKGSFESFMTAWYSKNSQVIMDSSGLYEKIANEASIVLSRNNAGIEDLKKMVDEIVFNITNGVEIIK
jgi:hypothetical protein